MSQMGSVVTGASLGSVLTLTGNTGGPVSPSVLGNINVVGSGSIVAIGDSGTNTVTISGTGGGISWNEVTATSANMAIDNGYIANNAGLVTLTLPAIATVGSNISIVGKGAGLWRIAQNAGQTIHFNSVNTTTGAGGYLEATVRYNCVSLVCITANTDWVVMSSVGNITYV